MSDPTSPAIGGRYELLEEIGRGGSATVHRARDVLENRWVAVKVIPVNETEEGRRRWNREAAVVSSLRHPALVTVFDQDVDDDTAVLVMELLPDGSLRDRLRLGPLDPAVVATVGADIAAGLAHIHGRGIVHRDVKPANVLLEVRTDGEIRGKLTDFGIAKLLESATTTSSTLIGTALYLSPEQAQGHAVGTSSDVYSLGLTLLEALTGRPAFPGTIAESLTARLLRDPSIPSGFGYGWRSLISAMTTRDPAQRPTAAEAALRLREIMAEEEIADTVELQIVAEPTTEPIAIGSGSPRARRRPVRIGLAAAALTAGLTVSGSVMAATPAFAPVAAQQAAAATTHQPSTSPSASPSPTAAASSLAAPSRTVTAVSTRSSDTARGSGTSTSRSTAKPPAPRAVPKQAAPKQAAPPRAKQHAEHAKHRQHAAKPKSESKAKSKAKSVAGSKPAAKPKRAAKPGSGEHKH